MNLFSQEISIFILMTHSPTINDLHVITNCFSLTQHSLIFKHTLSTLSSPVPTLHSTLSYLTPSTQPLTTFQFVSPCHFTPNPPNPPTMFAFRRINSISLSDFTSHLNASKLFTYPPSTLPELITFYFSTLRFLLDKHALPSRQHLHALVSIFGWLLVSFILKRPVVI